MQSEVVMNLYEIDQAYRAAQDRADAWAAEHAGEMLPEHWQELDALEMDRDAKIQNSIRYYKNENAIADMIEAEMDALKTRIRAHRNAAERTKAYMASIIRPGEKSEYGCGKVSWRGSETIDAPDINALPAEYVRVIPEMREPDKIAIKAALKRGEILPVTVVHHDNIQIK
jgi:hypothetical protein